MCIRDSSQSLQMSGKPAHLTIVITFLWTLLQTNHGVTRISFIQTSNRPQSSRCGLLCKGDGEEPFLSIAEAMIARNSSEDHHELVVLGDGDRPLNINWTLFEKDQMGHTLYDYSSQPSHVIHGNFTIKPSNCDSLEPNGVFSCLDLGIHFPVTIFGSLTLQNISIFTHQMTDVFLRCLGYSSINLHRVIYRELWRGVLIEANGGVTDITITMSDLKMPPNGKLLLVSGGRATVRINNSLIEQIL
eukprot:TRINITY_DN12822_c0_g1_i2.p1 TRINITY_DN12822_c0_g1~~TRINITY_DN12822_c0_g1_i2.p1  ORF type:complete len:266 (-),score=24.61 TRINITY_DN12822_c0_g1_i2:493-1227(-)